MRGRGGRRRAITASTTVRSTISPSGRDGTPAASRRRLSKNEREEEPGHGDRGQAVGGGHVGEVVRGQLGDHARRRPG